MRIYSFARRLAAGLAGPALLSAALAGCTSEGSLPSVAFPSDTAPSVLTVPNTPVASFTGYAPPLNAITATITGFATGTKMTYPMTPVTFTVTVKNTSTFAFKQLEPLIVVGQCTCDPTNYSLPPHSVVEVWDVPTNAWKSVPAAEMGPKGDFSFNQQVGSINLDPKATVSYKFRISVAKTLKETGLTNGTGSLDFYLVQLPGHSRVRVGLDPDATIPLAYKFP